MTGFAKLTLVEAKLILRDVFSVPISVVLPTLLVIIFGLSASSRRPDPGLGGIVPIDTVLPSLAIAVTGVILGLNVLPIYLGTHRERGVLRRLSTTPAEPRALLGAQLVINLAIALASLVLMYVVGALALGMSAPRHLVGFIVAYPLGLSALFAMGLLVAAVAKSARMATGLGFLFFFPSMFFAGIYLPKERMPAALGRIGDFTPLGAFRQTVQDTWAGSAPNPVQLLFLAALTVVLGATATRLFRWE